MTISLYAGKHMVNIREYYEKEGEYLPGKKVCFFMFYFFASIVPFDMGDSYSTSAQFCTQNPSSILNSFNTTSQPCPLPPQSGSCRIYIAHTNTR